MSRNRDFGRRVKQAREDAGLKRKDLATLARIEPFRIVLMETGQVDQMDFGDDELRRLADVLGKPLAWLVTGEAPRQAPVSENVIAQRSARRTLQLPLGWILCPRCQEPVRGVRCDNCGLSSD